ncbi:nitrile hydratase [Antricoccus suffuscus]|uniref:Nitrile hydratase subunit beta n=1 Tax=Antricoccus suffuscus TaxID=1629062 RepID=A0A2T0ZYF0_9ACTN|nr:nitrile hydratase subunit beta [Antricoccus suffuscus]PRZ41382.1 nitrile hydratase [Antricoccus suffuscus]
MNGPHDMGGMQCYGPVTPELDEPAFHADWERRVLAYTLAVGALGQWNIDQSRSSRESLPPVTYLTSSYYEIWRRALENYLVLRGMVTEEELRTGQAKTERANVPAAVAWEKLEAGFDAGSPYNRSERAAARFSVGDRVHTRMINPAGHTRLPRYARNQVGTVERVHGSFVFPDRNAATLSGEIDKTPEWLYTVVFDGRDVWGADTADHLMVSVDAWEPYLEPAQELVA